MSNQASILMIDDDEVDIFSLERALRKSDDSINFAAVKNGQYFLDEYRHKPEHKPDLILLDINMPGINGLALLEILKDDGEWKDTPVVMFTTSDQESDRQKSISVGAVSYLTKPSNSADMQKVVSTISSHLVEIRH